MYKLQQDYVRFKPKLSTYSDVSEESLLRFFDTVDAVVIDTNGLRHLGRRVGLSTKPLKRLLDHLAQTGKIRYGVLLGKPIAIPTVGAELL
jgi:hypothetical protein